MKTEPYAIHDGFIWFENVIVTPFKMPTERATVICAMLNTAYRRGYDAGKYEQWQKLEAKL